MACIVPYELKHQINRFSLSLFCVGFRGELKSAMVKPPPPPALIDAGNLRHVPSVEKFFTKLHALLRVPTLIPLPLIIDLRSTWFIYPEGALALICAARLWHQHTGQKTILYMKDDVHSYLDRIDLFTTCETYFERPASPAEPFARTRSRNLLEVIEFSKDVDNNAAQIPDAIERAFRILYYDFDRDRTNAIGTLFSEIAANIPHSRDNGYAIVQRYPKTNTVHMGIADLGVGFQENLMHHRQCTTFTRGSEFIKHILLKGGITSRDGDGGMGLYTVNQIVQNGEGVLTIRSGSSIVQLYQNDDLIFFDDLPFIPGVQVFLSVFGAPQDEWRYG